MRELKGTMDGYPVVFLFNSNGFEFTDIGVRIGLVVFEWEQLSALQHIQILQQLEQNFPFTEQNYN